MACTVMLTVATQDKRETVTASAHDFVNGQGKHGAHPQQIVFNHTNEFRSITATWMELEVIDYVK